MVAAMMTLAILAQPAPEKVQVEFHLLPPGHELTLKDGKRVRYYLLHEWLELAAADLQLRKLKEESKKQEKMLADYGDLVRSQGEEIAALESSLGACDNQSARRLKKYQECEKALVEASTDPIWPYLVGIAGAVVGIVGTTLYLSEKLK